MSAPKTAAGLDPDQLARACADAMWADDKASRGLGMEIVEVGPGRAVIAMTVREEMVNGHGICHGGFVSLFFGARGLRGNYGDIT